MGPIEFLLGVVTFGVAVKLKKPIRKVAVITAGQILGLTDRLKAVAYGLKEEVEDIVAEAQYQNMKRSSSKLEEPGDNKEINDENGGGV